MGLVLLSDEPLRVWAVPPNALPEDPDHHPGLRAYVGATLDSRPVAKRDVYALRGGKIVTQSETKLRSFFVFDLGEEPVTLPDTLYYRHALAVGDLAPADEATKKLTKCRHAVGVPEALLALREAAKADAASAATEPAPAPAASEGSTTTEDRSSVDAPRGRRRGGE